MSVGRTNYLLKTSQFKRICPTQACTTRVGDSWKQADLRALLFLHYARESQATSGPLTVEGYSKDAVNT